MANRLDALYVLPEIDSLATEIFTQEEMKEVDLIDQRLLGTREQRRWPIARCVLKVGLRPPRPLLYWQVEMRSLPRNTRNSKGEKPSLGFSCFFRLEPIFNCHGVYFNRAGDLAKLACVLCFE